MTEQARKGKGGPVVVWGHAAKTLNLVKICSRLSVVAWDAASKVWGGGWDAHLGAAGVAVDDHAHKLATAIPLVMTKRIAASINKER